MYEAAGKQYYEDHENYIRRYDRFPVRTCVSSSTNSLYYKFLIHTAEPRYLKMIWYTLNKL